MEVERMEFNQEELKLIAEAVSTLIQNIDKDLHMVRDADSIGNITSKDLHKEVEELAPLKILLKKVEEYQKIFE